MFEKLIQRFIDSKDSAAENRSIDSIKRFRTNDKRVKFLVRALIHYVNSDEELTEISNFLGRYAHEKARWREERETQRN